MATRQREDTVLEAKKNKTKPPPMFKVLLLNDDYTPMDFVIAVLQKFFALSLEKATQIMLKVHREESASVAFTRATWRLPKWNRSSRTPNSTNIRYSV